MHSSEEAPSVEPLLPTEAPKLLPALDELVQSEAVYVGGLRTLVGSYLPALSEVLDDSDISTIFGACEAILEVNERLLTSLEAVLVHSPAVCLDDRVYDVSDAIFISTPSLLKVYSLYAANFVASSRHMLECQKHKPAFEKAVRHVENAVRKARTGEEDRSLTACLILPVKRICLYPLLLDALVGALSKTSSPAAAPRRRGFQRLQETVELVGSLLSQVNQLVRDAEAQIALLGIHQSLDGAWPDILLDAIPRTLLCECRVQMLSLPSRMPQPRGNLREGRAWLLTDRMLLGRPVRAARGTSSPVRYQLAANLKLDQLQHVPHNGPLPTPRKGSRLSMLFCMHGEAPMPDAMDTNGSPSAAFWLLPSEAADAQGVHLLCEAGEPLYAALTSAANAIREGHGRASLSANSSRGSSKLIVAKDEHGSAHSIVWGLQRSQGSLDVDNTESRRSEEEDRANRLLEDSRRLTHSSSSTSRIGPSGESAI